MKYQVMPSRSKQRGIYRLKKDLSKHLALHLPNSLHHRIEQKSSYACSIHYKIKYQTCIFEIILFTTHQWPEFLKNLMGIKNVR
jgi:hypothetical protein